MHSTSHKAFLSHQSNDKDFAETLATCLMASGVNVFFDKWDIGAGESVPAEIEKALQECDLFLYILSPSAIGSKWVQEEYHAFLYRKINDHTLRIIPIVRKTCKRPPFVAHLRYIDFQDFKIDNDFYKDPEREGPLRDLLDSIFHRSRKPAIGTIHPAQASYEFYFQPMKNSKNPDKYEIGFKNLTDGPLHNFEFSLQFREPVESVEYDFPRSSANFTGGQGLSLDKKKFHWLGNQIMENSGWVVFLINSKVIPVIERVSTILVGRQAMTNKIIPPDPNGLIK